MVALGMVLHQALVGKELHLAPADKVLHLLPGEADTVLHLVLAACRIHWELRWDTWPHNQVVVVEKPEMWPDGGNDWKKEDHCDGRACSLCATNK